VLCASRRSSLIAPSGTLAFKRGISAFNHPDFYRQIGKEPQELVSAALALLAKRFDLR
jgi:hypothetical protein